MLEYKMFRTRTGVAGFQTILASVVLLCTAVPHAQPLATLEDTITEAIISNPRVVASWYEFEAAAEEQKGARGAYLPRLDANADVARERRRTPQLPGTSYTRDSARLSLTQMLFDGFETRNNVARLGFGKLARFYDLKAASEDTGFDATLAYLDVLRQQSLVQFAQENYQTHSELYARIQERTEAGVGRGADLEQATSRLALAESNLLTELTNLHDVKVRFQRITGRLPAATLAAPEVPDRLIPASREVALQQAYENSPAIDAAIEELRASQAALDQASAPMRPRFDLRLREERDNDMDGVEGRFTERAVEVVMSYNLYRGGADRARQREFRHRLESARQQRIQACLDVRQNVSIAFNDIGVLRQQLELLERNLSALEQARRAYFDQFDLGQRTLLDLLDTQNELFDTQRAKVNAEVSLQSAQARTLRSSGLLLASVGVAGLASKVQGDLDLTRDAKVPDQQGLCPSEMVSQTFTSREEMLARLAANGADPSRYRPAQSTPFVSPEAQTAAASVVVAPANEPAALALELLVLFESNSSVITNDFDGEIANAAQFLREHAGVTAVVEGHTDDVGAEDYNQWLSQRRSDRVRELLIERYGVPAEQVSAVGYGQSRPIADSGRNADRARDRRVELVLYANR